MLVSYLVEKLNYFSLVGYLLDVAIGNANVNDVGIDGVGPLFTLYLLLNGCLNLFPDGLLQRQAIRVLGKCCR